MTPAAKQGRRAGSRGRPQGFRRLGLGSPENHLIPEEIALDTEPGTPHFLIMMFVLLYSSALTVG